MENVSSSQGSVHAEKPLDKKNLMIFVILNFYKTSFS